MSQDSHGQWVVSIQAVLLVEQRILHLQLAAAQVINAAALFQKVHLQQQSNGRFGLSALAAITRL